MVRDDPIVSSLERTGLPPWQTDAYVCNSHKYSCGGFGGYDPDDDFEEGDEDDVYFGNQTSEF